jgi:hypothetical protein
MPRPTQPTVAAVALDAIHQAALAAILEEQGYAVAAFAGAEEALEALASQPPVLFVSGLAAPQLEGWRLCRRLRSAAHAGWREIPILLVSETLAGAEAESITAELGGDGLLPLPLEAGSLREMAGRLLRREHTAAPAAAREQYQALFSHMLDGFALHEMIWDAAGAPADYRFLAVNPAFERMTGLHAGDILGKTVVEVLPGTERSWIENYGRVASAGEPYRFENYHAGLEKHFEVLAFRPAVGQFACIVRDVTERKERETKIRRLSYLNEFLSQVNQAIVRAECREDLFASVCRVGTQFGRFRLTWVGLLDAATGEIRLQAQDSDAPPVAFAIRDTECAVSRRSIEEARPAVCNRMSLGQSPADCHGKAMEGGVRSCAAFPIRLQGKVCGSFCVHSAEEGFFRDAEVRLLEEVALDISFALDKLEADRVRREVEEKFAAAFEHLPAPAAISVFEDGTYLEVNRQFETAFGYSRNDAVGKTSWGLGLLPLEERTRLTSTVTRQGRIAGEEIRMRARDGRLVDCLLNAESIIVGGQRRLLSMMVDLTERKRAEEQKRLSEQRYRSLFEHMLNGFAYCKMLYGDEGQAVDFVYLEVNAAFEQLTGLRNVVGRRITEIVPGIRESNPALFETYGRVAAGGPSECFEFDFKLIARWLSISVYSPEKGFFIAVFDDISERKQHEADRETMMAILRLLNSPNDTHELVRAVTGLLQEWSGCTAVGIRLRDGEDFPYYETLGFPAEFLEAEKSLCARGANRELLRDSQGNPVLECMCGNVLCGRFDPSLPFFTASGSFWTNSTSALLASTTASDRQSRTRNRCHGEGFESVALIPLNSAGRTLGLIQFNDRRGDRFTPAKLAMMERAAANLAGALAQRNTQVALRASQERYRLISENTADVIWLLDLESSRFTYVSPSVQQLLGYSAEEFSKKDLRDFLTPESYRYCVRRIAEGPALLASGNEALFHEVHRLDLVRADGKAVRTEIVTSLLSGERAPGGQVLGVTRDITERVEAEARLMQAQKMESVGRLAGGVAHDFNNLLTVINGYSRLVLADLGEDDPLRESIGEILGAGERAAGLTQQLLAFSRKQVLKPRQLDLNRVVSGMQPMLARLLGEDVALSVELHPAAATIRADPHQLEQVVMNLAVNARDAMPHGGKLHIRTAVEDGEENAARYVMLAVSDNGVGMDEETRRHIFEPFFTTKEVGKGTGLGLSMVQGIVEQSGGHIEATSEPGRGTTFQIRLPRVENPPAESQEAEGAPTMGGMETVLVVEDQAEVRKYTAAALRAHGYRVMQAENAGEALRICQEEHTRIDLVLTDVVMPDMSGKELSRRLAERWPAVRVLFMSGYSEHAGEPRGEGEKFANLIQKPFSPGQLAAKVREILLASVHPARILVADDEAGVRKFFRTTLEQAGYQVTEAENGKQAYVTALAGGVDLAILDLVMPEQEGIETIRALRKEVPGVRILAVSGAFGGLFLSHARMLGADVVLSKPVSAELLLAKVAEALGRQGK